MLGDMTNRTASAADLIDAAASFADDEALSRALCEVDDLVGHEASSTAEVVHNLLASLAYLLTAARRDARALPAALSIYKLAAATLATWRLDLHAECWADDRRDPHRPTRLLADRPNLARPRRWVASTHKERTHSTSTTSGRTSLGSRLRPLSRGRPCADPRKHGQKRRI